MFCNLIEFLLRTNAAIQNQTKVKNETFLAFFTGAYLTIMELDIWLLSLL